jgi:hypothetical protein
MDILCSIFLSLGAVVGGLGSVLMVAGAVASASMDADDARLVA